jgi:Big-like domain-containing protein
VEAFVMRYVTGVAILALLVLVPAEANAAKRRSVRHPGADTTPHAVNDAYQVNFGEILSVAAPGVLANDTLNLATIASYGILGSEQTTIGSVTATEHGTVLLAATGALTYQPSSGFTGTDTFRYVVTNPSGSSTALVNVTVIPIPPSAVDDAYATPRNVQLSEPAPGVLANDTLNTANIAAYGALAGSEQTNIGSATPTEKNGTIRLNADGSFVYSPATGFTGSDTFKYVLANAASIATATVTIAVQGPAAPDFTVTSPGFFYSISGLSGENPVLTLTRGRTYTFQIHTDSFHPFQILNAPPGSVTNNNIFEGIITFAVPAAAANYRYHCSIHDFGNTITTVP